METVQQNGGFTLFSTYFHSILIYSVWIGYYFQQIIWIGFHTDAFEQLGPSSGAEDRGRFLPEGVDSTDGPQR